jgi:hypothetical protein
VDENLRALAEYVAFMGFRDAQSDREDAVSGGGLADGFGYWRFVIRDPRGAGQHCPFGVGGVPTAAAVGSKRAEDPMS